MNTAAPDFNDYASRVLDLRDREGVRGIDSERNRYRCHIEPAFQGLSLVDVNDAVRLRAWCAEMQMKPANDTRGERLLSTHTVHRAKALISAVLGRAVEDGLIRANECLGIKLRKRADEITAFDPWTFLVMPEQRAFATSDAISEWHRIAIRVAIGTGMRQGEQMCLELPDVHVDGRKPHLVVRIGGFKRKLVDGVIVERKLPPKNGKRRTVPLFGDGLVSVKEALAFVKDVPNPHGLLFPTPNGNRRGVGKPLGRAQDPETNDWECAWKLAKREVGISRRLRWHDLRHTFASNLVSGALGRRWSLEEIRPVIGHSSITMTQRYAHVGEDALFAAARATDGTLEVVPEALETVRELLIPDAIDTLRELCAEDEESIDAVA